jgi:hypothetical protein
MSEKLDYFKFQNACNPFGILFHPLAIEKLLLRCGKKIFKADIFFIMSAGTVMMLILI